MAIIEHVGNNPAGRTKNSKLNDENLTSDSNICKKHFFWIGNVLSSDVIHSADIAKSVPEIAAHAEDNEEIGNFDN